MKKLLLAAVLLLGTITMSAANYTNSVGGTAGTMYGFTYKGFVFGVDGLALQLDLGLNLPALAGKMIMKTGNNKMKYDFMFGDFLEFQLNPNFVYQSEISSWGWGSLDWFIGGGLSLGFEQAGFEVCAAILNPSGTSDMKSVWLIQLIALPGISASAKRAQLLS